MRTYDVNDAYNQGNKKLPLPPGVTQEMIDASLAANPQASAGGFEGVGKSYTGGAAPPGPATPGNPIPGVDPFRLAQASDAYNRALASVNSRRGSTLTTYGFKASGFDDSGNPLGLEVDPNSQYGSYQQMLQGQARESIQAEDDASGRGFSGGLANQGEGRLKYDQGAQRLQLGQGILSNLGTLNTELLGAKKSYDDTLYQARLDAARAAVDAQDFTPVTNDPYSNPGADGPGLTFKPPAATGPNPTATTAVAKAKALAAKVVAKKVSANKTGATFSKARGVISIH